MKTPRGLSLLMVSASALALFPAIASAVTVPNTARPENVQKNLRLEKRPEVSKNPIISVDDKATKEIKGGISFVLNELKFDGVSNLDIEEIKPLYQAKIGTKVSLNELNKLAGEITAYYRNKGLILTRAILPPQRIEKGVAKIRIVEGFVSDVQLRGDVGGADGVLYKYAEKIKASKPLDAASLERYLLLMEDLPGVEARAVIQPSPNVSGASQVVVNITRKKYEGTSVAIDNRGTRYLGPIQASGSLAVNNIFGLDEQTAVRGLYTPMYYDQLRFYDFRHQQNIGSEGTKIVFDANYVESRPDYTLSPFEIEGKNYAFDLAASHPILRSRQTNWLVNADFAVKRVNLDSLSTNLYNDDLRVLTAGTAYDFVDSTNAVNRVAASMSKGFSWYTDSDGLAHSRSNGESSFWKWNANVTRIQPIYGAFSATISLDGQYSADPLYATEEYTVGGKDFGSAYDVAEISGDSGLATRAELQYNGAMEGKYLSSYQLYTFYDIGKVWNRDVVGVTEEKSDSIASTGFGTRFNVVDDVSGGLELALPLTKKVAANGQDGDAPRLFFNLQYRY